MVAIQKQRVPVVKASNQQLAHHAFHHPILGKVCLEGIADTALTRIYLEESTNTQAVPQAASSESVDSVLMETEHLITRYLLGETVDFTQLPMQPEGTDFQQRVWQALMTIPWGETRSYAWVAEQLGIPKASRAVGQANRRNPIPIIIPCHRVIQHNQKLGGYAYGLYIKRFLLYIERANSTWDIEGVQQRLQLFAQDSFQQAITLL